MAATTEGPAPSFVVTMTTAARTGPLIGASGKGHAVPAVPPSTTGCQCLTAYLRTSRGSDGSDGSDERTVSEQPLYLLTGRQRLFSGAFLHL